MEDIIQLKVEDRDNFIYLLVEQETKQCMLIDPAWDSEGIWDIIYEEQLELIGILITHAHHDHINAVNAFLKKEVTVFVSAKEYPLWKNAPKDAVLLQNGDEILFGSASIQMIETAGHTAGSCCYLWKNHLITGDTLFIYGAGNVKDETASAEALFNSLQKIKKLSPDLNIWCGHDYGVAETTTLKEQLNGNPFLMIDDKSAFIRFRTELASKVRSTPYAPISPQELKEILDA